MLLASLNPDIRSVLMQLADGDIDLDPEFQRGDVWNVKKQQMLVDTVLREWEIPPIFLIKNERKDIKEVLDGHQRLQAIKHFYKGRFKFDGRLEPRSEELETLHGMFYQDLPDKYRKIFNNFALRTFELSNYEENEPFELFFRLNQNATLTSAERRNTFFGPARDMTKELVSKMLNLGFDNTNIGFNNTRLAYHDVIARVLYSLEKGSIEKKINDSQLTERYRMHAAFDDTLYEKIELKLILLIDAISLSGKVKLNKPVLFSLIIFLIECAPDITKEELSLILNNYSDMVESLKHIPSYGNQLEQVIYSEYSTRISTGVNDGRSVVFRQFFFCWVSLSLNVKSLRMEYQTKVEKTIDLLNEKITSEDVDALSTLLNSLVWGELNAN